jgi:signal peptidase I
MSARDRAQSRGLVGFENRNGSSLMRNYRSREDGGRRGTSGRPGVWWHLGQGLVDVGLWVLGCLGLLSLLAAIAAHIWGLSIILFSTGSMTPTIPAGSAALVQLIPASEIRVGDVVTVERVNALPVTHRVTSLTPSAAVPGDFVITMKGDANQAEDVSPYQVSQVRRVLSSVPGVAASINRLRDPRLLAGLTVVAGGLVTWAFWPRRTRRPSRVVGEVGSGGAPPASGDFLVNSGAPAESRRIQGGGVL